MALLRDGEEFAAAVERFLRSLDDLEGRQPECWSSAPSAQEVFSVAYVDSAHSEVERSNSEFVRDPSRANGK